MFGKKKSELFFLVFGIFLVIVFLMPLIVSGTLNVGNALGLLLGFLSLSLGFFFSGIKNFIGFMAEKSVRKIILAAACAAVFFSLIVFFHAFFEIASKTVRKETHAGTVIVLGCQVVGESPNRMLSERIQACLEYLERNPESTVILSGGKGRDEKISEAECMYRELVKNGVSPDRLIKEEKSTSTRENLAFSKEIILEKNLPAEVVLITNEFHCYRASFFAERSGLHPEVWPAKTNLCMFPTFFLREICVVAVQCPSWRKR